MAVIAAAIDIGTNSVKLTVGRRAANGRIEALLDQTQITRLGKGVDASGRLNDEAMHRTLTALASFGQDARNLGATRIGAVGTSALRDAVNGAEFVHNAERDLGGPVEVISGDREAELTYTAALHDPDLDIPRDDTVALTTIDIGGGSTEVVVGNGGHITFRKSLQLGAVRLTERTLLSNPPSEHELRAAEQAADTALTAVPVTESGSRRIITVGSGGTIANLAAMEIMARDPGAQLTPDALHSTRLTLALIESRIKSLSALTLSERRKTPGLEPDRADVILGGAVVLARALRRIGAQEILVSARGLRFGLLYELLETTTEAL